MTLSSTKRNLFAPRCGKSAAPSQEKFLLEPVVIENQNLSTSNNGYIHVYVVTCAKQVEVSFFGGNTACHESWVINPVLIMFPSEPNLV